MLGLKPLREMGWVGLHSDPFSISMFHAHFPERRASRNSWQLDSEWSLSKRSANGGVVSACKLERSHPRSPYPEILDVPHSRAWPPALCKKFAPTVCSHFVALRIILSQNQVHHVKWRYTSDETQPASWCNVISVSCRRLQVAQIRRR